MKFHLGFFALFAVLVIALSGVTGGFLVADGNGLLSKPEPNAPSTPLASTPEAPTFDGLSANAVGAAAIAHDPSMATELASVPSSVYQGLIDKVLAIQATHGAARQKAIADLVNYNAASTVTPAYGCNNCAIDVGSLAVAVAIAACVAGGAESLGTICIGAFIGAAIATALAYVFGTSAANAVSEAVESAGHQMLKDLQILGFSSIVNGTSSVINALNATQSALGYQGAAAALAQLPNTTYSAVNDLSLGVGGSSIAAQLASEYWANGEDLASALGYTMNNFDTVLGSSNPSGYTCPLGTYAAIAGSTSTADILAPYEVTHGSATCPDTSVSFTYPYGSLFASADFSIGTLANGLGGSSGCPAVWLNPEAGLAVISGNAGGGSLSTMWIPVNGSTPWYNLTATSAMNSAGTAAYTNPAVATNVSITAATVTSAPTFPIGGYYVCVGATGTQAVLHAGIGFPLNLNAGAGIFNQKATDINYISNGASSSTGSDTYAAGSLLYDLGDPALESGGKSIAVLKDGVFGTIPSGYACETGGVPSGGCPSPWNAETYLGLYLWNLAQNAAKVGQVYWTFLRGLGYTSVSQVPPQCDIPSPSQLLPSVVSVEELSKMSAANLSVLYLATLAKLGYTFNASSSLTVFNFCGKHVVVPPAPWPLSTKAYGWIYVPNATGNSTGLGPQKFSSPDTWNYSGLIYIQPILSGMTVPLNSTWLLPDTLNPSILFVQPISDSQTGTTRQALINQDAPTTCLTTALNCNQTGYIQILGPLTGNSTRANGSAYPANRDSNPYGYAVFLTACWYETNDTTNPNPTYGAPHPSTCHFGLNVLSGNGSGGPGCQTAIAPDCGGGGGCGIFGCGGGTGVECPGASSLWVFGSLVNGVAGVFAGIPLIGTGVGCFIGYVVFVALLIVLIFVAVAVINVVRGRRG